eukprot:scaffold7704_cov112-Isochrysis_galbana.AAC.5
MGGVRRSQVGPHSAGFGSIASCSLAGDEMARNGALRPCQRQQAVYDPSPNPTGGETSTPSPKLRSGRVRLHEAHLRVHAPCHKDGEAPVIGAKQLGHDETAGRGAVGLTGEDHAAEPGGGGGGAADKPRVLRVVQVEDAQVWPLAEDAVRVAERVEHLSKGWGVRWVRPGRGRCLLGCGGTGGEGRGGLAAALGAGAEESPHSNSARRRTNTNTGGLPSCAPRPHTSAAARPPPPVSPEASRPQTGQAPDTRPPAPPHQPPAAFSFEETVPAPAPFSFGAPAPPACQKTRTPARAAAATPGALGTRRRAAVAAPMPNHAHTMRLACGQNRCWMARYSPVETGRLASQWKASTYSPKAQATGRPTRRSPGSVSDQQKPSSARGAPSRSRNRNSAWPVAGALASRNVPYSRRSRWVRKPLTLRWLPHDPHAAPWPPCTTRNRYGLRPRSPHAPRRSRRCGRKSTPAPGREEDAEASSVHTAKGATKKTAVCWLVSASPATAAPAHARPRVRDASYRTSAKNSAAQSKLLRANTSDWTAYCQTSGAKAKAPPAASPAQVSRDQKPTAAQSMPAARASKTALERLTRHAGVVEGIGRR